MGDERHADHLDYYGAPIAKFLSDDTVQEVFVNAFDRILIEQNGRLVLTDATFKSEVELQEYVRQIANKLGQTIDPVRNPILDARLPDGTRINAVLPPVAVKGTTVCMRPFRREAFTYDDLVENGSIPRELTPFFREQFERGANVIVSGATGSGKTTFLRTMTSFFEPGERVVVLEDTNENIVPSHDHVVAFEAPRRTGALDKEADITMARLIQNAMRQSPERIVVGEIRSPEAANAYIEATNTGHTGCLSTTHANSPDDALRRIATLNGRMLPGANFQSLIEEVQSNTHVVVHVAKFKSDRVNERRVSAVNLYTVDETKTVCFYNPDRRQFELSTDCL